MAATAKRRLNQPLKVAIVLILAIVLTVLLLFVALQPEALPDKAKAFPRAEIVVGVDGSFPPFAVDDGQMLTGLDIELARAIADHLELPIRFVNIGYYGLYDALISGEVDMLISALRVDPARMDDLRYTRHYFDNGLILVSPADDALTAEESIGQRSIAFEFGSSADAELRNLETRFGQAQRFPYELPQYALDAVRLGIAQAALVDAISLRLYLREHPGWHPHQLFTTHELYAIALPKQPWDTWKLVDDAVLALKESGQLATIVSKWL